MKNIYRFSFLVQMIRMQMKMIDVEQLTSSKDTEFLKRRAFNLEKLNSRHQFKPTF